MSLGFRSAAAEAAALVVGDRAASYGRVTDDFGRTAALWSIIIGAPVKPEHVPLCMIALKMSRELHKPQRDNRVDIAGYVDTLEKFYWEEGLNH